MSVQPCPAHLRGTRPPQRRPLDPLQIQMRHRQILRPRQHQRAPRQMQARLMVQSRHPINATIPVLHQLISGVAAIGAVSKAISITRQFMESHGGPTPAAGTPDGMATATAIQAIMPTLSTHRVTAWTPRTATTTRHRILRQTQAQQALKPCHRWCRNSQRHQPLQEVRRW